ncbi:MAG: alpha/beta hydrolase [Acidobacteria bacterium]|nr:alpha/beta hydrolase [Acidobacteriota bacterium]
MTVGTKVGVSAGVLVVLVLMTAAGYVYKRPLSVYAWFNRRLLKDAGLTESTVAASVGPQTYWSGGRGQTLVLLHGAGDHAGTWSHVAEKLGGRYRLVIPDLAGHAASAPAEGPLSVSQVLAGFEAVMNQISHDPVIIVGNSLGAWIALLYAREHPDRVARLVLVDGGALRGDRQDLSLMPRSREEAVALMSQLRDPGSDPIPGYVLDDVVREANVGPIARMAQTASEMDRFLLEGKLHEIAAPVDLLWGESDKLLPLAYARRMMADLPASRLTTLPACGHVPHVECPSRFDAALSDILQSAPPSRRVEGPGTVAGAAAQGPGRR